MLEHKIPCKVLKIFIQEGSNDDLGLTLSFTMARSYLLSGLFYGNSSRTHVLLYTVLVHNFINVVAQVSKRTDVSLGVKIII